MPLLWMNNYDIFLTFTKIKGAHLNSFNLAFRPAFTIVDLRIKKVFVKILISSRSVWYFLILPKRKKWIFKIPKNKKKFKCWAPRLWTVRYVPFTKFHVRENICMKIKFYNLCRLLFLQEQAEDMEIILDVNFTNF